MTWLARSTAVVALLSSLAIADVPPRRRDPVPVARLRVDPATRAAITELARGKDVPFSASIDATARQQLAEGTTALRAGRTEDARRKLLAAAATMRAKKVPPADLNAALGVAVYEGYVKLVDAAQKSDQLRFFNEAKRLLKENEQALVARAALTTPPPVQPRLSRVSQQWRMGATPLISSVTFTGDSAKATTTLITNDAELQEVLNTLTLISDDHSPTALTAAIDARTAYAAFLTEMTRLLKENHVALTGKIATSATAPIMLHRTAQLWRPGAAPLISTVAFTGTDAQASGKLAETNDQLQVVLQAILRVQALLNDTDVAAREAGLEAVNRQLVSAGELYRGLLSDLSRVQ